ncbi:MAG: LysR family transcriptional regulator [Lachnospiraceae bacterium]|nr:LysR family transcriptional regulator [Lachnospiraceae bacterium]
MELRHIRYFLAVASEGSISKAAEKLCIAQPPLSRQIKDLEQELDTELFVRRPRGLVLTRAGEQFYEYARRISQLADASVEELRDMKAGLSGNLFLATVEGYAPALLAEWIAAFRKVYPMVGYELWNGNTDDVVKRVQTGLSDIAVITAPYDEEGLEGWQVWQEPWVAMLPAEHPLVKKTKNKDSVKLQDLAPYELIIPSRQSRKKEIEQWFAPLGLQPKIFCRMAHMLNAYELTAKGVGIAIYPASVQSYVNKDVVIRKITSPEVTARYILVRNAKSSLSLVAEEFWGFVMGEFLGKGQDQ